MNELGFVFVPQKNGLTTIFNPSGKNSNVNFTTGDTITATLIQRGAESVTLKSDDGFTFQASADSVYGDEGDELRFRVIKKDKSGIALRQIFESAESGQAPSRPKNERNIDIQGLKKFTKTLEQMNEEANMRTETREEQAVKTARALASIKKRQNSISGNASRAAVAALVENGIALHKISFVMLDNAVRELKKTSETQPETRMDETAAGNLTAAEALRAQGLPESKANISALERTANRLSEPVSDMVIERLIFEERDITPNNIYISRTEAAKIEERRNASAAKKTGGRRQLPESPFKAVSKSEPQWEKKTLDNEISKLFKRENINDTEQNREAAYFLSEHYLPINSKNIEATAFLRRKDPIPQGLIYEHAASAIANGENPGDIDLLLLETVRTLPKINNQDINAVNSAELPVDLKHLAAAAQQRIAEEAVAATAAPLVETPTAAIRGERNDYTTQRILAEIQLKMTVQAAVRLTYKQIRIDTEPLQDLVQYLRQMENDTHSRALRAAEAGDTKENVERMDELFKFIIEMRPLTANAHSAIMTRQVDFTVAGVREAVMASRAYEAVSAIPNPRYGDSFENVREQFGDLLTRLGMTPTAENIRAAGILSRNSMDITPESVLAVKEIDAKVDAVARRLHPMAAAHMLKEGLIPQHMQIDDLLARIERYETEMGYHTGDKIAQHIMEMDRSGDLSEDERERVINVYRMLYQIQRNESVSLGKAITQNAPITLGGLLEAAKFKGMDIKVDGSVEYSRLLADAAADKAAPKPLNNLMNEPGGLEKPLEDILRDDWADMPPFSPSAELAYQQLRLFTEAPPSLIARLQDNGTPVTAGSLQSSRRASRSNNSQNNVFDNEIYEDNSEDSTYGKE